MRHEPANNKTRSLARNAYIAALAVLTVVSITAWRHFSAPALSVPSITQCTITNLHKNTTFLKHATPITGQEFLERRRNLAVALRAHRIDAFILEPGYTFQYYANVSQVDWEPWEPEERPTLMIVRPTVRGGRIEAKTDFLTPAFEEGRLRMLGIPETGELDVVAWEEHWDPYVTLRDALFGGDEGVRVMVDEEIRDYIVRGLTRAGFETVGLGGEIEAVRQVKSEAEIAILRAVNTGTVEAIRAMRPCTCFCPGALRWNLTYVLLMVTRLAS